MTQKLSKLIWAMGQHEGWFERGNPKYPDGSLAYRNHNPLNLRHSKFAVREVAGFAVFENDSKGVEAAAYDITQKALGHTTTGLNGESSLADLIRVWAPASDNNNPEGYLQHVIKLTGFPRTMKLKELIQE